MSKDIWADDWNFKFDELVKHGMNKQRAAEIAQEYANEHDKRDHDKYVKDLKDAGYLDDEKE